MIAMLSNNVYIFIISNFPNSYNDDDEFKKDYDSLRILSSKDIGLDVNVNPAYCTIRSAQVFNVCNTKEGERKTKSNEEIAEELCKLIHQSCINIATITDPEIYDTFTLFVNSYNFLPRKDFIYIAKDKGFREMVKNHLRNNKFSNIKEFKVCCSWYSNENAAKLNFFPYECTTSPDWSKPEWNKPDRFHTCIPKTLEDMFEFDSNDDENRFRAEMKAMFYDKRRCGNYENRTEWHLDPKKR